MSSTRSSSPTLTGSVTSIVGKTTVSSSGTSKSEVMVCLASLSVATNLSYVVERRRGWRARDLSLGDSTWRHSKGTVESDHFPVQHRVLDDVAGQRGPFLGAAQAPRGGTAGADRHARP